MKVIQLCAPFFLLLFLSATKSLEHEKSFLLQDGAIKIYSISLYRDSLLITSSNHIIQKDIETGILQRTFRAHEKPIRSFTIINESKMVTSGWDDMIIVWDLESGSVVKRILLRSFKTMVSGISLWNNQLFAGGQDKAVRQVDLMTGKVVRTTYLNAVVSTVLTNGDFLYVGTAAASSQIEKFFIPTLAVQFKFDGHSNSVLALFWSESILFSGSYDTTIACWNSETGALIRTLVGHSRSVTSLIAAAKELYSAGEDGLVIKWNIDDGTIMNQLSSQEATDYMCLAIRDKTLFGGTLGSVVIKWNVTTGLPLFIYRSQKRMIRAIALWKTYVISGGENTEISVWDVAANIMEPYAVIFDHQKAITSLLVYEDTLLSGSYDTTIRHWNLTTLLFLKFYLGHIDAVSALVTDNRYLYSGGFDYIVKKWDIMSGKYIQDFIGHSDSIVSLQFGDGILFSGSFDATIKVWDVGSAVNIRTINTYRMPNSILLYGDSIIYLVNQNIIMAQVSTGDVMVELEESGLSYSLGSSSSRIYSGQEDGAIKGRDVATLIALETFAGHNDVIVSLFVDEFGILFSGGMDGSLKKWNMGARKAAFSLENRKDSVTSLAAYDNLLLVGTLNGAIHSFNINSALLNRTHYNHEKAISSLMIDNTVLYSSGLDGAVHEVVLNDKYDSRVLYNDSRMPLTSLFMTPKFLLLLQGESAVLLLERSTSSYYNQVESANLQLTSLVAADGLILAGTQLGEIIAWDFLTLQRKFNLKGHTSRLNFLTVYQNTLLSASDDKTIIQWSLRDQTALKVLKRYSATALGHLGPVNSLSMCNDVLFSAGSDTTVRRWNIITGRHEDVYFGFTKSVTSVICYNSSVFAGSEDFSVLMFKPMLPNPSQEKLFSTKTKLSPKTLRKTLKRQGSFPSTLESSQTFITMAGIISSVILVIIAICTLFCYNKSKIWFSNTPLVVKTLSESNATVTDLETIINSVIGISKHAAFLIEHSSIARIKKLASGGGGELFVAQVMEPSLSRRVGELVIQKVVFIKSKMSEEAFYQEVGIMIMLSKFPRFCQIIGYTENPSSIILKYYQDGSLSDWLRKASFRKSVAVMILKDIAESLNDMHSHFLAHCDLKPQNVLVEIITGIPSCFVTDFGITQILSDNIIASRSFNVINLRGLSVSYASPEAFRNFKTKKYVSVDFKKYDIFSFGCLVYELLIRRSPWC